MVSNHEISFTPDTITSEEIVSETYFLWKRIQLFWLWDLLSELASKKPLKSTFTVSNICLNLQIRTESHARTVNMYVLWALPVNCITFVVLPTAIPTTFGNSDSKRGDTVFLIMSSMIQDELESGAWATVTWQVINIVWLETVTSFLGQQQSCSLWGFPRTIHWGNV